MRIISLTAENIKRLVAVDIRPTANMVKITGRNGQGKTSVLDAIWWAIGGAKHIQVNPIRKGANKARIKLDLGELMVTRTFTREASEFTRDGIEGSEDGYTTELRVVNAAGQRIPGGAQELLNGFLNALCFDPLEFARKKPKEKFDMLRLLVPKVDFALIDAAHQADYDKRTNINRLADEARARAASIEVPEDTPTERVDEDAIISELQRAGEFNAEILTRKTRREALAQQITQARTQASTMRAQLESSCAEIYAHRDRTIQEINAQIAALQRRAESVIADAEASRALKRQETETQASQLESSAATNQARLDAAEALPEPKDPAEIRARLDKARAINANVLRIIEKVQLEHNAIEHEQQARVLTDRINARQQAKRDAIAEANLPVEGLGFGDNVVLFNGQPFEQASDAEQWRVSCAIAMANNPQLRVMRIRQGSLLDDASLALIDELCEKHDFQCWIEIVDSSGEIGFVLEDGKLKAAQPALVGAA